MTHAPGPRAARAVAGRPDPAVADELGLTVYDVARDLRRDIEGVRLPLPIDGATQAEGSRGRLIAQLDEHLLPRLRELSSPAIVVVAGSTGAGKSTLYNSLLGEEVSQAGVLRPTTREPVLAFNPLDREVIQEGPATSASRVVFHDGVPRGTALLDAPDLDSFLADNRSTAQQLLEAADLWLFVTTASRYGDALPWQALSRATERGASVAMVLNRVPRETLATIRADLMLRLREHGMTDVPLFVVPDVGPHEGLLDPRTVQPVRRWLTLLAGPERSRAVIVRTLKGALGALPAWVTSLADAVEAQGEAAAAIRAAVERERPAAERLARDGVLAGVVAGASVEARWRELSGRAKVDRLKVKNGLARSTGRAGRKREEALDALRADVEAAASRTLVAAGGRVEERLRAVLTAPGAPAGAVAVVPDHAARTAARESTIVASVTAWSAQDADVVAGLGAGDDTARVAAAVKAFGPRGLGSLLLASAAGSDDAGRLLARVLGAAHTDAVATLRADLADRAAAVIDGEIDAVLAALDTPNLADDAASGLRVRLAELRRLT
ncbi:GTPase [Xylanimonas ulmi]|uniref:50S ribosome-binding GTPase n=1 Tax=Xylanimonas ulmi TaxID=228973 RepID=A0A4Q7M3P6_9MICO|nr:GTPase domain-containing protein [Xylanibacterium ulmi]RZS61497.1 50S ribosome-binding GTPase [Xylanibacterium ulmi]